MRNFISNPLFIPIFAVAACASTPSPVDPGGDDDDSASYQGGDHGQADGIGGDVTPPVAADCDYTEGHDATNDYLAVTGASEQSGIVFDKTVQRTICGSINHGHFDLDDDGWDYEIDVDNYDMTLAQDTNVIVTLTTGPQLISQLGLYAYNVDADDVQAGSYFIYDHGVYSAHLQAGHYQLSVEAYDDQDIDSDVPYKMHINVDQPVQRCGRVTAPASYTEAYDGANSTGNDAILIDGYSKTASQGVAEVAAMTMAASSKYRIAGVSDAVAEAGTYYDRDTYQFTTGSSTNQISVRLNWTGQTSDLDYYLFDDSSTFALGGQAHRHLGEDEFGTFPVAPNHSYWLWIGASSADADSAWVPYNASICAEQFAK